MEKYLGRGDGSHILVFLHLVWLVSGLLNNDFNIGERRG